MKNKLSKSSRYAFIASLCGGLSASVLPTRHDLVEEIAIVKSHQDSGELPMNDDLPSLTSVLIFDETNEPKEEIDAILSKKEKEQVKRDLTAFRVKRDVSKPISLLALVVI